MTRPRQEKETTDNHADTQTHRHKQIQKSDIERWRTREHN